MAARVCSSWYSSVHCQMLAVRSITPKGLAPFGKASTSVGARSSRPCSDGQASQAALPHGYTRWSVPCAAYCHSHSCGDRKSTRLNSSHLGISYAVFCLKKKKKNTL